MTRRAPALRRDEVAAAVRCLLAEGVVPSQRAVAAKLGHGSIRTINRLLRELRQEAVVPPSAHPLAWVQLRTQALEADCRAWQDWARQVTPILAENHLTYPSPPSGLVGIDTCDDDLPIVILDEVGNHKWCTTNNHPPLLLLPKLQVPVTGDCKSTKSLLRAIVNPRTLRVV